MYCRRDAVEHEAQAAKNRSETAAAALATNAQQPVKSSAAANGGHGEASKALPANHDTARFAHAVPPTAPAGPQTTVVQPRWTRGGLRGQPNASGQQPGIALAATVPAPLSAFAQIGGTLPLRPYNPWPTSRPQWAPQQGKQGQGAASYRASVPAAPIPQPVAPSAGVGRASAPAVLAQPHPQPRPDGAQQRPRQPHQQQHLQQQQPQQLQQRPQPQQQCPVPLPPPDWRAQPPAPAQAQPCQQAHQQQKQNQQPQRQQPPSHLQQQQQQRQPAAQSKQQAAVQHVRAKMEEFKELVPHLPPPPPRHIK